MAAHLTYADRVKRQWNNDIAAEYSNYREVTNDDHDYSDSSKLDVSNVSDTSQVASSSATDSLD
ncbi:unnamed protein product [Clavelina lepadiformis]|uniref:Uncharacterized protein n=1 Tax=Clavelina lepadiformis TaxID=159417 RepID=A0ABP0G5A1_CLALP